MRDSRSHPPACGGHPAARRSPAALLAAGCWLLAGCSWFTDFKEQPKVKPWQEWKFSGNETTPFRSNPQYSVPIDGEAVPAFMVSYANAMATIDSMSGVPNPRAATDSSVENGRKYYQINCAVCHGAAGKGDGPALQFGVPAPALVTSATAARSDGYLYGMIRNGRNYMPTYDRIEEMDRWDVVNYVRALQRAAAAAAPAATTPAAAPGAATPTPGAPSPGAPAATAPAAASPTGAATVSTQPAGLPGQNGAAVPGPSQTAPTRPSPFYGQRGPDARLRTGAETTVPAADTAAGHGVAGAAAPSGTAPNAPGDTARPGARRDTTRRGAARRDTTQRARP